MCIARHQQQIEDRTTAIYVEDEPKELSPGCVIVCLACVGRVLNVAGAVHEHDNRCDEGGLPSIICLMLGK